MYSEPVGVSVLTNAARLDRLKACVSSILHNCYYRPLVFGVFDNGSTDGTKEWLSSLPETYGVEWRVGRSDEDLGCAAGTNRACELVKGCEYALHVESDFEHVPERLSGEDRMWLRRALGLMESERADYLYLRRMVDESDMMLHWWSQWMGRVDRVDEGGRHMRCPGFWWSNNPHLRRNAAAYGSGALPLREGLDGGKGSSGWSRPELSAGSPGSAWIHRWGMFVHELGTKRMEQNAGCLEQGTPWRHGCKYGFFKGGEGRFCGLCDRTKGFEDMRAHEDRLRAEADK